MIKYQFSWNFAYPGLGVKATFKEFPEDFYVEEILGFELSGEGEHYYIQVEKVQQNTNYVAERLANWAKISSKNISFAGLKDKQSISRQWFSIWLPGKNLPAIYPDIPGVKILQVVKHSKKLKRGALSKNKFKISLKNIDAGNLLINERLDLIKEHGVPNYFGHQRFGIEGNNVNNASEILSKKKAKRELKSIVLSSLRSYLFNTLLSFRVKNGSWNGVITGQPLQLSGTRSWFLAEGTEDEITRVKEGDCSPTCPLYSEQFINDPQLLSVHETELMKELSELTKLMDKFRLEKAIRATVLRPENFSYTIEGGNLLLSFSLPPGCYATVIIREIIGDV